MGVSTRKVTEITEQLCGLEISATQVSRVLELLEENMEVRGLKNVRPLLGIETDPVCQ